MASIDELRKQQMMEKAGVKPPVPGLVQQVGERRTAFPTNIPERSPYEGSKSLVQIAGDVATQAFPNTVKALDQRRSGIDAARQKGGISAAIGQSIRSAGMPLVGLADDVMNSARVALDPAAQVAKTLVTGDATPIGQSAPQAPRTPIQASYSNEGRNFTNPIVAAATTQAKPQTQPQPEAPAAEAPQARQIAPGIFRSGNSYGDSAEAAISGPRGSGQPSARNMAAADALASRYAGPGMTAQAAQPAQGPSAYIPKDTGGYGLLDKGYRDRRAAMMDAQQMKPGARTALAALLKEQSAQGDREAKAEQNAADRGFRQGENALDRGLKSQELMARMDDSAATRQLRAQELQDNMATNAVKRDAAGVEVTIAKQMADLRSQYLNAKTDAERNDAARKLQALSGKADTSLKDNFMVVGGGQEWDANAMAMRNVPQQLIDLRTGRPVTGGQAQAPAQGQFEVGKVYMDAQGRKAKYTENGWQPI